MRIRFLYCSVLLAIPVLINAQSTCACCTAQHRQFDFWLGEWMVFDTAGKKLGENSIVKLEDQCLLSELWQGAGGGTGRSFNYYDPSDSTWNQLWLDKQGTILKLKGRAKTNSMILKSDWAAGQGGSKFYNRITWKKNEDGSVLQLWEILGPSDEVLSVAFKGIYKRKVP